LTKTGALGMLLEPIIFKDHVVCTIVPGAGEVIETVATPVLDDQTLEDHTVTDALPLTSPKISSTTILKLPLALIVSPLENSFVH